MDIRTIPDLLRHAIETHRKPDAFLLKRDGLWEPVSIDTFAAKVRGVEADLVARGVKHGDRVAILSENRLEWAIADQAILAVGAVCVPIYATLPPDHVGPLLADSGAALETNTPTAPESASSGRRWMRSGRGCPDSSG